MLPEKKFPTDQPLGPEQLTAVWTAVSGDLRAVLGDATFDLWFGQSRLVCVDENKATVSSPGSMYAIWIEENFRDQLKIHLDKYLLDLKGFSVRCDDQEPELEETEDAAAEAEVTPEIEVEQKAIDDASKPRKRKRRKRQLTEEEIIDKGIKAGFNETHTFENFVVGPNSKLAHAAANAVVDTPGTLYQPLFFHSISGLGKTHLLHAIGWDFLKRRPHAKVRYVTAEEFANEYIDAIRNSKDIAFRKKYRDVELLLIDDIQFLGGKSGFQTEFFHTFNSIMDQRNQIVVASDCLATELSHLEERLISRLQWGMTVEIKAPDAETGEAILRKKRDDWDLGVNDQVISGIVRRVSKNVRQLEGALIRTAMVSSLNEGCIEEEELDDILADMMGSTEKIIDMGTIKESVGEYFGVEVKEMESKRRMAKVTEARQVAMFLCRELTTHSLKEIAISFGKDHASVVYAVKNTKAKCIKSETLKNSVELLKRRISRGETGSGPDKTTKPKSSKSTRSGEYDKPSFFG